jgi:hypothetical protein
MGADTLSLVAVAGGGSFLWFAIPPERGPGGGTTDERRAGPRSCRPALGSLADKRRRTANGYVN